MTTTPDIARDAEQQQQPPAVACSVLLNEAAGTDLQFVADELDAIATLMWSTAERMEYFGGFKGEMRQHAHELAGAATIARGWAKAIRAKRPNDPGEAQRP